MVLVQVDVSVDLGHPRHGDSVVLAVGAAALVSLIESPSTRLTVPTFVLQEA
jgi:hypothetical protein